MLQMVKCDRCYERKTKDVMGAHKWGLNLIWRVRKGQAQFNFTFNLPLFRMRLIIGWYLPSRSEKL